MSSKNKIKPPRRDFRFDCRSDISQHEWRVSRPVSQLSVAPGMKGSAHKCFLNVSVPKARIRLAEAKASDPLSWKRGSTECIKFEPLSALVLEAFDENGPAFGALGLER